jgi:hypothetical protein
MLARNQAVAAHWFMGINTLPHIYRVHVTILLFRYILPSIEGQIHVAEFRTAVVVVHEGGLKLSIDVAPENAKVEAFKHVT